MFLSYSLVSVGCVVRNTRYQNKDNRKFNRQKRNLLKKSCHALQVQAHTPQLPGRLFSLTDIWKKTIPPYFIAQGTQNIKGCLWIVFSGRFINNRWYLFCVVDIPNGKCNKIGWDSFFYASPSPGSYDSTVKSDSWKLQIFMQKNWKKFSIYSRDSYENKFILRTQLRGPQIYQSYDHFQ